MLKNKTKNYYNLKKKISFLFIKKNNFKINI